MNVFGLLKPSTKNQKVNNEKNVSNSINENKVSQTNPLIDSILSLTFDEESHDRTTRFEEKQNETKSLHDSIVEKSTPNQKKLPRTLKPRPKLQYAINKVNNNESKVELLSPIISNKIQKLTPRSNSRKRSRILSKHLQNTNSISPSLLLQKIETTANISYLDEVGTPSKTQSQAYSNAHNTPSNSKNNLILNDNPINVSTPRKRSQKIRIGLTPERNLVSSPNPLKSNSTKSTPIISTFTNSTSNNSSTKKTIASPKSPHKRNSSMKTTPDDTIPEHVDLIKIQTQNAINIQNQNITTFTSTSNQLSNGSNLPTNKASAVHSLNSSRESSKEPRNGVKKKTKLKVGPIDKRKKSPSRNSTKNQNQTLQGSQNTNNDTKWGNRTTMLRRADMSEGEYENKMSKHRKIVKQISFGGEYEEDDDESEEFYSADERFDDDELVVFEQDKNLMNSVEPIEDPIKQSTNSESNMIVGEEVEFFDFNEIHESPVQLINVVATPSKQIDEDIDEEKQSESVDARKQKTPISISQSIHSVIERNEDHRSPSQITNVVTPSKQIGENSDERKQTEAASTKKQKTPIATNQNIPHPSKKKFSDILSPTSKGATTSKRIDQDSDEKKQTVAATTRKQENTIANDQNTPRPSKKKLSDILNHTRGATTNKHIYENSDLNKQSESIVTRKQKNSIAKDQNKPLPSKKKLSDTLSHTRGATTNKHVGENSDLKKRFEVVVTKEKENPIAKDQNTTLPSKKKLSDTLSHTRGATTNKHIDENSDLNKQSEPVVTKEQENPIAKDQNKPLPSKMKLSDILSHTRGATTNKRIDENSDLNKQTESVVTKEQENPIAKDQNKPLPSKKKSDTLSHSRGATNNKRIDENSDLNKRTEAVVTKEQENPSAKDQNKPLPSKRKVSDILRKSYPPKFPPSASTSKNISSGVTRPANLSNLFNISSNNGTFKLASNNITTQTKPSSTPRSQESKPLTMAEKIKKLNELRQQMQNNTQSVDITPIANGSNITNQKNSLSKLLQNDSQPIESTMANGSNVPKPKISLSKLLQKSKEKKLQSLNQQKSANTPNIHSPHKTFEVNKASSNRTHAEQQLDNEENQQLGDEENINDETIICTPSSVIINNDMKNTSEKLTQINDTSSSANSKINENEYIKKDLDKIANGYKEKSETESADEEGNLLEVTEEEFSHNVIQLALEEDRMRAKNLQKQKQFENLRKQIQAENLQKQNQAENLQRQHQEKLQRQHQEKLQIQHQEKSQRQHQEKLQAGIHKLNDAYDLPEITLPTNVSPTAWKVKVGNKAPNQNNSNTYSQLNSFKRPLPFESKAPKPKRRVTVKKGKFITIMNSSSEEESVDPGDSKDVDSEVDDSDEDNLYGENNHSGWDSDRDLPDEFGIKTNRSSSFFSSNDEEGQEEEFVGMVTSTQEHSTEKDSSGTNNIEARINDSIDRPLSQWELIYRSNSTIEKSILSQNGGSGLLKSSQEKHQSFSENLKAQSQPGLWNSNRNTESLWTSDKGYRIYSHHELLNIGSKKADVTNFRDPIEKKYEQLHSQGIQVDKTNSQNSSSSSKNDPNNSNNQSSQSVHSPVNKKSSSEQSEKQNDILKSNENPATALINIPQPVQQDLETSEKQQNNYVTSKNKAKRAKQRKTFRSLQHKSE